MQANRRDHGSDFDLRTLVARQYRSLRDFRMRFGRLTVITGRNGVGKSNVYRALELLHHAAQGQLASALVAEGGMPSALWGGPERARSEGAKRRGGPIQGTVRKGPVRLTLGVAYPDGSYEFSLGLPSPVPATAFHLDPTVKEERGLAGMSTLLSRNGRVAEAVDYRSKSILHEDLPDTETALGTMDAISLHPTMYGIQQILRAARFYHSFRTDAESLLRQPRLGTYTGCLASDGRDLAAALQTIDEVGESESLREAVERALGSQLRILSDDAARFEVALEVPGLLRPLSAREFSDGSLRYLAILAALHAPRPVPLLVFNEPESSLHADLVPHLADAFVRAAERTQTVVVTHHPLLVHRLSCADDALVVELERDDEGATIIRGQGLVDRPEWD